MSLQIGIVGLPNVGKSTLFSALTKQAVEAANFPFCTIDPNVGCVPVPDERLTTLAHIVQPERTVPTSIEFVDIAGLVGGAHKGEGMGNQFLSHIREVDAIAHVVRAFESDDITHVEGRVSPEDDLATIETELQLADLASLENMLKKSQKDAKSGKREAVLKHEALTQWRDAVAAGQNASTVTISKDHLAIVKGIHLLTNKPSFVAANVSEDQLLSPPPISTNDRALVAICAQVEAELAELDDTEAAEFLNDLGITEPGLHRLVKTAYETLGLLTFFTAGPKEVRAWTVHKGATAPQAAGVIHSDFEDQFIRAQVIGYEDFVTGNGEQGAREAGRLRMEGKTYVVQDGDVCHFHHGV